MSDLCILIVDDREDIRHALTGLLGDEGYRTIVAPDGQSALRLVIENQIDMVLLDTMLPDTNGIEVLEKIVNSKPGLPVVMFSTYRTVESALQAARAGAYDFIPNFSEKPYPPEMSLLTVRRTLETCLQRWSESKMAQQHLLCFWSDCWQQS